MKEVVDELTGNRVEKYDDDALLYQDVLGYALTRGKNNYFRTWDLSKWLLKTNQEYIKLYSGFDAHKRISEKVENIKRRVDGAVEDLVSLGLCIRREATAEKSHGPTYEYALGHFGKLVALLIESTKVENIIKRKFIYEQIYELMALPESSLDVSSRSKFTSMYMKNVKANGLFPVFVQRYATILFSNSGIANLHQFREMLTLLPFKDTEVSQLWELQKRALDELHKLDEHTFHLFLFNLKLDFERTHAMTCHQISKYEEMRFRIRDDSTLVCLEASCDSCHSFIVGGFNLLLYLVFHTLFSTVPSSPQT